jgi:single-strand DNA-binding protein
MASFNRVIMMGNLTRDPEYKQLSSGQAVCRLGLASNRQFKNKQTGSMVQEVCFVDIDVWGPQAEVCRQYLQKGRPVLIEGRLKFDSWQDQDGSRRSKHSIVADRITFLGGASAQESDEADFNADSAASSSSSSTSPSAATDSITPAKAESNVEAAQEKKSYAKKAKTISPEASTGEVVLKDESPFEDDLPF